MFRGQIIIQMNDSNWRFLKKNENIMCDLYDFLSFCAPCTHLSCYLSLVDGMTFDSLFRRCVWPSAHIDGDHLIDVCENLGQSLWQKQVNQPAGRIQQLPWNSTPAWGADHRGHVGLTPQRGRCIDKCWEGRWRDAFSAVQTPWSVIHRDKTRILRSGWENFTQMTSQRANLVK